MFDWQLRLQSIADEAAAAAVDQERAYQRQVMETGYATPLERVRLLKELVAALEADLKTNRRWVKDTKGIGTGDNWREIEIERFNSAEFDQLRGLLDDIAKETGGRPKTIRVDIEHRIRAMAIQLGLDPDEAVAEADRVLKEARAATR